MSSPCTFHGKHLQIGWYHIVDVFFNGTLDGGMLPTSFFFSFFALCCLTHENQRRRLRWWLAVMVDGVGIGGVSWCCWRWCWC